MGSCWTYHLYSVYDNNNSVLCGVRMMIDNDLRGENDDDVRVRKVIDDDDDVRGENND